MLIGIHFNNDSARVLADRLSMSDAWRQLRAAVERALASSNHPLTPFLRGKPSRSLEGYQAAMVGHFASALSAIQSVQPTPSIHDALTGFLGWIENQDVFLWGGGFVQGQFLKGAVLALDVVGESLPEMRRRKIVERLIIGCLEDADPNGPANTSPIGAKAMVPFLEIPGCGFHLKDEQVNNWDILSSMGLLYVCRAAEVILPERSEDIARWFDVARPRVERFFKLQYTEEGEYGEGPGYYSYGTTGAVFTLDLLHTWRRGDCGDHPTREWALPTQGLLQSPVWARQMHPREVDHGPFNVNDAYLGIAESPAVVHWIASRSRDGESQAFGDELMRLARKRLDSSPAAEHDFEPIAWSLIWRDASLAAQSTRGRRAQSFGKFGTVIARTGYSSDDLCLFFRCGQPAGAHTHADRGNFLLTAFGENLVSEGGRPLDRASVPEFMSFHHETWAHNCAMPAGRPQKKDIDGNYVWGSIKRFERSESHVTIQSELGDVYPESGRVERRLKFSFDGALLIEDFIEHPGDAIEFRLHTDNRDREAKITIDADRVTIRRPRASLVIFPLLADTQAIDDGVHFQDADREGLRSIILRRGESAMATLLVATRAGHEDSVHLERVDENSWRVFFDGHAETIRLSDDFVQDCRGDACVAL